jgi:hypothetical protein
MKRILYKEMDYNNTFGKCFKPSNINCFNSICILIFKRSWCPGPLDILNTNHSPCEEDIIKKARIRDSDEWIIVKNINS